MAVTRGKLLMTSENFLEAYNKWAVESILSVRSPSCIQKTGPMSLASPARNNSEFGEFVAHLLPIFRGFNLKVIDDTETLIDVERRKVMLHLRSYADTDVGPYENEYYFILTMTEDGEKVDEIVEFLDSGYSKDFMARLERAA